MRKSMFIACVAMLATSLPAFAGDKPVTFTFAGTGIDTAFDSNLDGHALSSGDGLLHGTFGNGTIALTAEWAPRALAACPAGSVEFGLVSNAVVLTFHDQSQLFGLGGDGWMCVNPQNGVYWGNVSGVYPGGTRRFQGVTGTWSTDFKGFTLDPAAGYRSISGKVTGKLTSSKK